MSKLSDTKFLAPDPDLPAPGAVTRVNVAVTVFHRESGQVLSQFAAIVHPIEAAAGWTGDLRERSALCTTLTTIRSVTHFREKTFGGLRVVAAMRAIDDPETIPPHASELKRKA